MSSRFRRGPFAIDETIENSDGREPIGRETRSLVRRRRRRKITNGGAGEGVILVRAPSDLVSAPPRQGLSAIIVVMRFGRVHAHKSSSKMCRPFSDEYTGGARDEQYDSSEPPPSSSPGYY